MDEAAVTAVVDELDKIISGLRDTIRHMKQFEDYAALVILVRSDADELQCLRDRIANTRRRDG